MNNSEGLSTVRTSLSAIRRVANYVRHLLRAGHWKESKPLKITLPSVECPEPVEGLCYAYILLCSNASFYVGYSHDLAKRLQRHGDGHGAKHTHLLPRA